MSHRDLDDGFDENGVRVNISGSLWKMNKGLFGGMSWKRRWVSCDAVQLIVWNMPTNHDENATPKYKFKLNSCEVETDFDKNTFDRQNVFIITDPKTKLTVSLATDTSNILDDWIEFMLSDKDYDEKLKDQEEKHRKELEEEKADRAIRFFDEEDGSTDLSDDETLDSFDFEEDDDNDDEDNDKDKDKKKGAESEEKNEQQLVVVSSILKKDSTVATIPRGGVDGEQKLTPKRASTRAGVIAAKLAEEKLSRKERKERKRQKLRDQEEANAIVRTPGRIITDYFHANDIASSDVHPVILVTKLFLLLRELQPNIDKRIINLICRDTNTNINSCIALPDMLEWYINYITKTGRLLEQSSIPSNAKSDSHSHRSKGKSSSSNNDNNNNNNNNNNSNSTSNNKVLSEIEQQIMNDALLNSAKEFGQRKKFNIMTYNHNQKVHFMNENENNENDINVSSNGNGNDFEVDNDDTDITSLCTGLIETELRVQSNHKNMVTTADIVELLVPDVHRLVLLESQNSIEFEDDDENIVSYEWNNTYQVLSDHVANVYVHNNSQLADKDEKKNNLLHCQDNITSCLNKAAFQSNFMKVAIDGAKTIIDEYSLPDIYKSIRSIDKKTSKKKNENCVHDEKNLTYQHDDDDDYDDDDELNNDLDISGPSMSTLSHFDSSFASPSNNYNNLDKNNDSHNRPSFHSGYSKRGDLDLSNDNNKTLESLQLKLEMGHQEMFSYKGLLFRINAHGVEEELDSISDSEHVQRLAAIDEVLHKTSGNEHRGLLYMKHASEQAYKEILENYVLADENNNDDNNGDGGDKYTKKSFSSIDGDDEFDSNNVIRVRTLLETVIDYNGFRVCVTCPVDVDEDRTLVHGFSSSISPSMFDNEIDMTMTMSSNGKNNIEDDRIFVDAYPQIHDTINRMSILTNIKRMHRDCYGTSYILNDDNHNKYQNKINKISINTMSKWLEFHKDSDGHLYMMNFDGVLIPDIPRSETHDLEIRKFRPEFVMNYSKSKLSPDGYDDAEDHMPNVLNLNQNQDIEDDSTFNAEMKANQKKKMEELKSCLQASTHFYTVIIPQLAKSLDTTSSIPLDSFSFTNTFHSYGVSMRHMGIVYSLTTCTHSKKMIISEAVSRSCKVLLNNRLKLIARKGKASTINADNRGHSSKEHYTEHMKHLHEERKDAVLIFFNLIFGSSKSSESFWATILADTVFQKFGFVLPTSRPNVSKYDILHLPQLFLSLQYHTGVLFHDHCQYDLDAASSECVFTLNDIINYSLPVAKPITTSQNKVTSSGFVGYADTLALPCMMSGVKTESISLLRLRMSMQLTAFQHCASTKDSAECSKTAYLLALALYSNGDYNEAIKVINNQIENTSKYTAMTGRFYMLNMCCFFKAKNLERHINLAVIAFDAAKAIFSYTLGSNHPVQALLMGCLSDQYINLKHYSNAMFTLTAVVDFSSRVLVDHGHILTAAYQLKLAQVHMKMMKIEKNKLDDKFDSSNNKIQNGHHNHGHSHSHHHHSNHHHAEKALDHLNDALQTYNGLYSDGANVTIELIECLYSLTLLNIDLDRIDEAIEYSVKCKNIALSNYSNINTDGDGDVDIDGNVNGNGNGNGNVNGNIINNKIYNQQSTLYLPDQKLLLLPHSATACILILSDLLNSKQQCNSAIDTLILLWNIVKRSPADYINNSIGIIYKTIAVRLLSIMFSQLPYPTRSLLETIAKEVEEPVFTNHGIEIPGAWAKAQETVFDAMWINEPRIYFSNIVDNVMKREIEGNLSYDITSDNDTSFEMNTRTTISASASKSKSKSKLKNLNIDYDTNDNDDGENDNDNDADISYHENEADANKLNIYALQVCVILRLITKHRNEI
jgi:hypothetical protein